MKTTLECPVHSGINLLEDAKKITYKGNSYKKYHCIICSCYYIHTGTTESRRVKIGTIKGTNREVYDTRLRPSVKSEQASVIKPETKTKEKSKGNKKKEKKKNTSKASTSDKIINIQRLKSDDLTARLRTSIEKINSLYPAAFKEKEDINQILEKINPTKISQHCYIRNLTKVNPKDETKLIRKLEIVNLDSSFSNNCLDNNKKFGFVGRLSRGKFVIEDIRIFNSINTSKTNDVTNDLITFEYGTKSKNDFLYELTNEVAKYPDKLSNDVIEWKEYLKWRKKLAEHRIIGAKYVGLNIDVDNDTMTFLTFFESKEQFNQFRKYLRRNEISSFTNSYSMSRWSFQYNFETQSQNIEYGTSLSYLNSSRGYSIDELNIDDLKEFFSGGRRASNAVEDYEFENCISEIKEFNESAVVYELEFELTDRMHEIIEQQYKVMGDLADDIETTLSREFMFDGFIATSQVGDLALNKRLNNAIEDFIAGKSVSQGLDDWLFDISKARNSENDYKVTQWQNTQMNEIQKEAVIKILSCPDVCLIQGPPGTGKTTVIAEAIYQFVSKNQRVLITSQANLAVDNALERIISNPKIRAIRLGEERKIDASVEKITENKVLESFYSSIVNYVDTTFLKKWNSMDQELIEHENDLSKFNQLVAATKNLRNEIDDLNQSNVDNQFCLSNKLLVVEKNVSTLNNIEMALLSITNENKSQITLSLSVSNIMFFWNEMREDFNALFENKIKLSNIEIDESKLTDDNGVSAANDIISFIISKFLNLLEFKKNSRITKTSDNSIEYEQAVVAEKNLQNQVLESDEPDIELIIEWKQAKKKVEALQENTSTLSEDESYLFGEFTNLRKEAVEIVKSCDSLITKTCNDLSIVLNNLQNSIRISNMKLLEENESMQSIIHENEKVINSKIEEYNACQNEIKDLLSQYDSTVDTFEENYNIWIQSIKNPDTKIKKNDWQDLLASLKKWIQDIPDYAQEKEVYLKNYINGCNVVGVSCTENTKTLSENGFDDFDVVIIDEVSKATPPELLIPMLRGKKIILVGDHRQLPPLFNEHEKTYQEVIDQLDEDEKSGMTLDDFNRYKDMVTSSLFEQYFSTASDSIKQTLSIQYRMHSDIMSIVNKFYDNKLSSGNENEDIIKAHNLNIRSTSGTKMIVPEKHAYWFDSSTLLGYSMYESRKEGSTSAENIVEAEAICELVKKIEIEYANNENKKISVGIISFYYDQVALIRNKLRDTKFESISVEINTVDRFQGKEKDIILVSLVRNTQNSSHNVNSHIAAFQRINVAFSRAKNLLVIFGAKDMFAEQPVRISNTNSELDEETYVYKEIIEQLNYQGSFFSCDLLIPKSTLQQIVVNRK